MIINFIEILIFILNINHNKYLAKYIKKDFMFKSVGFKKKLELNHLKKHNLYHLGFFFFLLIL